MNILGHAYVAVKALSGKKSLLITGSLLPETSPFILNNPFTWKEIHESGDKFLKFLDSHYPDKRDLALGIMAHSVKYGADKYNRDIEKWLLKDNLKLKRKLALRIVDCSSISLKVAEEARMHNYLWGGVDVFLLQKKLFSYFGIFTKNSKTNGKIF